MAGRCWPGLAASLLRVSLGSAVAVEVRDMIDGRVIIMLEQNTVALSRVIADMEKHTQKHRRFEKSIRRHASFREFSNRGMHLAMMSVEGSQSAHLRCCCGSDLTIASRM